VLPLSENEESLLLWRADSPFVLQVLAALRRVGRDVATLVRDEAGLKKVSPMQPKTKIGAEIPSAFEGKILWAPEREIFSNSPLSQNSLEELKKLCAHGQPLVIVSSQNSCEQILHEVAPLPLHKVLFFPALVGFGDQNFFESLFENILDSHSFAELPQGAVMSLSDAVSYTLSTLLNQKTKLLPSKIWCEGVNVSAQDIEAGFADFGRVKTQSRIGKKIKTLLGKNKEWTIAETRQAPIGIAKASEVFPSQLTPWKRFFRDSLRIYQNAPDGMLLLHFPPSRAP